MTSPATLCPHCEVETDTIRERRAVPLGQRRVLVDDEYMRCATCGEEFYTSEQADRRQRLALDQARLEDGLLSPKELKSVRERLGLTQREFERLLGVGEKTVVRWEAGRVCPNRATDRLIRLIAAIPQNVRMLAAINGVVLEGTLGAAELTRASAVSPNAWDAPSMPHTVLVGGTAEDEVPTPRDEELLAVRGAIQKLQTNPLGADAFWTSPRRGSHARS